MNIVIVAGGLCTRFEELSVFPKLLLATKDNDSILNETLKMFDSSNDFYIIINSKYHKMLKNYVSVNHTQEIFKLNSLNIISSDVANGSLSTLSDVYNSLPKKDVLFIWSDLIIKNIEIFNNCKSLDSKYDGIIFTSKSKYRYDFNGSQISINHEYNGNVPGIYYMKSIEILSNIPQEVIEKKNADFIDLIAWNIQKNNSIFLKIDVDEILEYKDLNTYKSLLKGHKTNLNQCRFFNSILIDKEKGIVTKEAINADYSNIINDEAAWYKTLQDTFSNVESPCPNIISLEKGPDQKYNKIIMEYLDGYIPLHEFISKASVNEIVWAYEGIMHNLSIFATDKKLVDKNIFYNDIEKELKTKVIDRCDKISDMLLSYDKPYLTNLLNRVLNDVMDLYKDQDKIEYIFCHGDLNGSNVMVNLKNPSHVKFLDPRGYFGFTKTYGWDVYEYSKLLYGLMGYDDFNLNPKLYPIDIPKNSAYVNTIDYLQKDIYYLIVGIIYIALAGYISQDIMKANIAYEYGIKLINDYYDKHK